MKKMICNVQLSIDFYVISKHRSNVIFLSLFSWPITFSTFNWKCAKSSEISQTLRVRYCPLNEYNGLAESIKVDEGMFLSSPIIQIEDFEMIMSQSAQEIYIRHNLYNWKDYEKCQLRCYRDLQNSKDYKPF